MQSTCELTVYKNQDTFGTEASPEPLNQYRKLSKLQKLELIFSIINRLLIGFVTFYILWMCLRIGDWTEIPWHAIFCTLGFLCFMSEGILALYYGNASTQSCNRNDKTSTHWILQLIGAFAGIFGILIKLILEGNHFHTLHGKIGLCTFVFLIWSFISGISSLHAHQLRNKIQPMLNKATHTILGLTTYFLSILSMFTAFETEIFLEYSLDGNHYTDFCLVLKVIVIIIFLISSYGPIWCLIYSKLWKCC